VILRDCLLWGLGPSPPPGPLTRNAAWRQYASLYASVGSVCS
jgi:hypothetical protein